MERVIERIKSMPNCSPDMPQSNVIISIKNTSIDILLYINTSLLLEKSCNVGVDKYINGVCVCGAHEAWSFLGYSINILTI